MRTSGKCSGARTFHTRLIFPQAFMSQASLRRRVNTPLVASILSVLATSAWAQTPAKVTFADHILPIFRNACANCHNPDKKKAGLDVSTYEGTMQGSENGSVVKPGDGNGSLLLKVCNQTEEPKMPPKGDKLSDNELSLLKKWIDDFALETASSKPAKAVSNKVDVAVVSLTKPAGPAPMPTGDLPLEPVVRTRSLNAVTAMAASPWAPLVAIGGQKQVLLYHTETLKPLGILPFTDGYPTVLRFSKNGQLLMIGGGQGGKSGLVALWNVTTGDHLGNVGNEADSVLAADLSPDHQFVALGGPAKLLKIYNTKTGKLAHSIKKHTDWVTAVAYSPDGQFLASGDRNGGIVVWEGSTGKEYNILPGHKSMCTSLAFMPGVLASGSEDGTIVLWDAKEGKEIRKWNAHAGGVAWVDFSPDGRLASCGRDKTAKIWEQTGKELLKTEVMADLALRCVIAGDQMIAGDWTGKVGVWAKDGKRRGELLVNPPTIAEQLDIYRKKGTELEAALPKLRVAYEAAQKQLDDAKVAAAAKKAEAVKAAEDAVKKGEAAVAEIRAEVGVWKTRLDTASQAVTAAEKTLATATAAVTAAAKTAEEKTAAKAPAPELEAATAALAKAKVAAKDAEAALAKQKSAVKEIKAESDKLAATRDKRVKDAEKNLEEPRKRFATTRDAAPVIPLPESTVARITALKASSTAAEAEITKWRDARAKTKDGSPEFKAAEAKIVAAKAEVDRLAKEIQQAPSATLESAVASAKAAVESAEVGLRDAKGELARWERAASFQTLYRSRGELAAKQDQLEDAQALAKDAFKQVEQARANIAGAEKTIASSPAAIAAADKAFQAAKGIAEQANSVYAEAQTALAAKEKAAAPGTGPTPEAEVAAAQKKWDGLNAEIGRRREARAKLKEGTPEYIAADAKVQAIKPEIEAAEKALAATKLSAETKTAALASLKAEIEKAKTDAATARLAAKTASEKATAAEDALNKAKGAQDAARKTIADLKGRIAEMEKAANTTRAQAESDAKRLAREIEEQKGKVERLRAEFETRYKPTNVTAR